MPIQQVLARVLSELRSAWRFRWYGAVLAWLVSLFGWAWIAWMPNVYEARARVYVDSSSVLQPILENRIVPPDIATQLAYIRQSLLGREHLERVMRENGLDSALATAIEREEAFNKLRADIGIESRDSTNSVYSITYRNSDREKAVGVVRTLLNSLVEATLGANRRGSDTAEQFLDDRIREYENRLQQAENARANFKKRNADRLPGSEGGYFEKMAAEKSSLEKAEKELRLAETKRDRLQSQLSSESPVAPSSTGAGIEPPPNSLDARIRDYRAELDKLLLQYTDKHPDVVNARAALGRLEQQRNEQLAALGVTNGEQEVSSLGSNPIYQSIRIALNDTEVEIDGLKADVRERSQKLGELQALVDEVPEVEAELARLNRDYDVIYDQYQSMVQSRETQALSRKASDTDEVEFRVIDPPLADFEPVAPKRLFSLAFTFIASLGVGGGLCWLLAQLRPVFTSIGDLREICGLPVLGAVSQAWEAKHRARRKMAVLGFIGVMSCLVLLYGAVSLLELVGPGLHVLVGGV